MPTCPACGVSVGYDELRTHVGTCRFVWSEAPGRTDRLTRHLVDKVHRLEERLQRGDREQVDDRGKDQEREEGSNHEPQRLR